MLTLAAIAAGGLYYLFLTRLLGLPESVQKAVAAMLGAAGVTLGSFLIIVVSSNSAETPKARWRHALGPLGTVQLASGLALLFWAGDFYLPTTVAGAVAVASALVSVLLRWI